MAAFAAAMNPAQVRLAVPERRAVVTAALAALGTAVAAIVFGDEALDALEMNPESFRIAAGLVLAIAGLRTLVRPDPGLEPVIVAVVTPELAVLGLSFGADEPVGRSIGAAIVAAALVAGTALARRRAVLVPATRFLAALEVAVAVALVVAGVRDV